jgi:hypothetical protein
MRRGLYETQYHTLAAWASRDHAHSVRVDEQRADRLGGVASGAAGAGRCEIRGEQLAQHSGRGVAVDSHRISAWRSWFSSLARCSLTSLHLELLFYQRVNCK